MWYLKLQASACGCTLHKPRKFLHIDSMCCFNIHLVPTCDNRTLWAGILYMKDQMLDWWQQSSGPFSRLGKYKVTDKIDLDLRIHGDFINLSLRANLTQQQDKAYIHILCLITMHALHENLWQINTLKVMIGHLTYFKYIMKDRLTVWLSWV